jgi:hypothetical protein
MLASTVQFSSYGRNRLTPTAWPQPGLVRMTRDDPTRTGDHAGRRGATPVPSGPNSVPKPPRTHQPFPTPKSRTRSPRRHGQLIDVPPMSNQPGTLARTWPWTPPSRGASVLLRKEVIQPHLPVRLPCYDFVPIANPTFDGSLPRVGPPASGVTDFRDVTGGVYKARERIHRSVADLRLLATPTSWGRVADPNPN